MVTYCSQVIPNAAAISELLRRLTHTKQEWMWKEEQEKPFDDLRKSLCKAVTLSLFYIGKPTTIVVDTSPHGLGAILTQSSKDGSNSLIVYASRLLTDKNHVTLKRKEKHSPLHGLFYILISA